MVYNIWSIAFREKLFFLPKTFLYMVYNMTFQVLLSERKKFSFLFPMQYCVGIEEMFPDSGVPNLCKPHPLSIDVLEQTAPVKPFF